MYTYLPLNTELVFLHDCIVYLYFDAGRLHVDKLDLFICQAYNRALTVSAKEVLMNICVFCSASDLPEHFVEPARVFARLIGENGHNLVWGGSVSGLMGVVADEVEASGGKLYGVSMELIKNTAREVADEMIIAKDLSERKAMMLEKADAVVTLVGGTGTLDELTEVFELKRHGEHNKPIVMLNTENFWNNYQAQLQHMHNAGFLNRQAPLDQLIRFARTPEEALDLVVEMRDTQHEFKDSYRSAEMG